MIWRLRSKEWLTLQWNLMEAGMADVEEESNDEHGSREKEKLG